MTNIPPYFAGFNVSKILEDQPINSDFLNKFIKMSKEELRSIQEKHFQKCIKRAWKIQFYKDHWGKVGLELGDINSLDDINKIPTFDKKDLMKSIANHPPFGDFSGTQMDLDSHDPAVMHTTSGTTGTPQVLLFSPKTREIQNLLVARAYLWQGLKGNDIVHSVYGHGMVNAGHYMREAVIHFTNAIFCSAGTGVETRSTQQIEIMKRFKTTFLIGFVDYIKRLAIIAKEMNIEPGKDIPIKIISGHFGLEDRNEISRLWGGAECFDWYGVGDTGIICSEGPDHDGMYIWEDAHFVEILNIDDNQPIQHGAQGNVVNTVLFKDDLYPMIRFNTHDISAFCNGNNNIDLPFQRMQKIFGRSDNMIKLKGINIFPNGIGQIITEIKETNGEFFCKAIREPDGRDNLIVMIEVTSQQSNSLKSSLQSLIKSKVGIEVIIELFQPGELSNLTEVEKRQKPLRLKDTRFN